MKRAGDDTLAALLYCILFFAIVNVVFAPPPSTKPGIIVRGQCDPNCTCSVNGQSYSEGDQWSNPADPCTVYRCMADGQPNIVSRGCSFNGECRDVDSSWVDKCNTFTCKNGTGHVFYSLQEAGCELKGGGCMRVGERRDVIGHVTCDVNECQLNNGVLQVTETRTGCRDDNECRSIGSYWYDGCVVFTCTKANDTLTPVPVRDVMHWPDGEYALLKPHTGCPQDAPALWRQGSRTHYGAGLNTFSAQRPAYLSSSDVLVRHDFCVHTTVNGTQSVLGITSGLVTVWGPGSYCIFRSNGRCPEGFSEGYLKYDDNDARPGTSDGYLPDGDFNPDTGLFFCCRGDGSILSPMTLPTEASFILFPTNTEMRCQAVTGMVPSLESVTFDGTGQSNHTLTGSLPVITVTEGDVTLNYCLYKQVGCAGCPDGKGGYVAINTEKQTNCVVKKCVAENGVNVLKIIQGGCEYRGRCQDEDSIWHETTGITGSTCEQITCKRVLGINGVSFEMQSVGHGCIDDGVCHDVGATTYKNCYTSECQYDETTMIATFTTVNADCPWLNSCKPVNTTWQQGCMLYRCNLDTSEGLFQWNVQPVDYGCDDGTGKCLKVGETVQGKCYDAVCRVSENKTVVYLDVVQGACEWNNTCYKQNATWSDGCVTYICVVTRHAEKVNWSVETVRVACRDFNGQCIDVGETLTEKCVTYECRRREDRLVIEPSAVACNANGVCQPENSEWMDEMKCIKYKCSKTRSHGTYAMQISVVDYGCSFNGTCKPVNATWLDGCRTRQCKVIRSSAKLQRSVGAIAAGCDDEGICRPEGYKKVSNTCMEYECLYNKEYRDAFFTLRSGACQSSNGSCPAVNSTWIEEEKSMCLHYECRQEKIGYLSKMIQQDCRDARGVCQPIGSTGFESMVDGLLKSNCRCLKTATTYPGVEIKCAV